ncbi:MAG: energy transducer TonB [Bacteroidales bacterium]|nr:energy transducer TonB [Bacteroidales bacterium]
MTNGNKNKIYGAVTTIVFHAIAFVLLLVLCFRTPLPLPGEAGVEIDMGMYAQGMGFESSQDEEIVEDIPEEQQVPEEPEVEEEILSEDEDIPALEEETEEKPEEIVEEVQEEVVEEKPVVNQRAMFQAPKVKKEPSSQGNTEDTGDQGKDNGLKGIDRYEGNGGSGGGPSYDLGGRGAKSISTPSRDFSEEGKVVVDIWVDKEGRVQRAEIGKGTTIANSSMLNSAKTAALNSIFNKDDKATDLQKGTITYTFIIRQ